MASYNPVFSSQFILGSSTDGYPSFDVPDGYTAVVRDFSIWAPAAIAFVLLEIQNSGAAAAITAAALQIAAFAGYSQWQGRVVVPGGGIISITRTSVGDSPDVYVGGYLLANTLP